MKALFSLRTKIMLLTVGLLVVSTVSLSYMTYTLIYQEQEKEIGIRLQAIAATGALLLSGDLHDKVRKPEDSRSAAFLKLRKILRKIKMQNKLETELYTFRRDGNRLRFIVMTNKTPYVGDTYQIKQEMLPALNDGKTAYTRIFRDQHGAWISAYAPIRNSKGKIVGILDVDHKLSTFMSELRDKMMWLMIFSIVLLVVGLFFSISLSGRLVNHLKRLTEAAKAISMNEIDTPVNIQSRDEVGDLSNSLERLRESLKIAMEMLENLQQNQNPPY